MITYYSRSVDAGAGRQNVLVKNGVVVKQYLVAREGHYTGPGNPEIVGQPESGLRSIGFRQVRGPQVFNRYRNCWISIEVDETSD